MKQLALVLAVWVCAIQNTHAQNLVWAEKIGGWNDDEGNSIAVDAGGNVYVGGYFWGTVDFDPGPGIFNLSSNGKDFFIMKMNASGNLIWVKQFGEADADRKPSVTLDAAGNVYATGHFTGTVDFDPNNGVFNLTSSGSSDIFIIKLDTSGNLVWAKKMGGSYYDYGHSVAVDAAGNVYATGSFSVTADFDPPRQSNLISTGSWDVFIVKLDSSGNFVWAKRFGDFLPDGGSSVAVDAAGNVYATGNFQGTADFDPSFGTFNLISAGDDDIFIVKLNVSGNLVWAKQFGGTFDDDGTSIAVDDAGNVFATGHLQGTVDFDPGPGTLPLSGHNWVSAFVTKLDASGNLIWAKHSGGDYSFSLAIDAGANVYTTGFFEDTADFDPGPGTFNLASFSTNHPDVFISKLNSSGNFIWAKQFGGMSRDWGYSVVTDASENVYATGYFYGTGDYDPGSGTFNLTSNGDADIFVLKLKPDIIISGAILTETGSPIPGATVTLSGNDFRTFTTAADGRYNFSATPGASYTITPSKSNDVFITNGITSVDVLLIRRHILGNGALGSPYKIIAAAEVNAAGDTTITTQDILFTRSLILGNITSFPTNRLWQFVPSDYVFPDVTNPFPFPNMRTYTNITTNQTGQDFIGIKLGDVNGSWDPNTP